MECCSFPICFKTLLIGCKCYANSFYAVLFENNNEKKVYVYSAQMYFVSSSIFHLQLVDLSDVEPADSEGLLFYYGIVFT